MGPWPGQGVPQATNKKGHYLAPSQNGLLTLKSGRKKV